MGLINFWVNFENFAGEPTLRFDVKFHRLYSCLVKLNPAEYVSFIDLASICDFRVNLTDIREPHLNYAEISNVNEFGEVSPIRINIKNSEEKTVDELRLLKKIKQGDIIKPQKGCILLSSVRPYLKKFVLIDENTSEIYFTNAFIAIKPKKINSLLLYYLLRSLLLENLVRVSREGKGYPTIKKRISDMSILKKNI